MITTCLPTEGTSDGQSQAQSKKTGMIGLDVYLYPDGLRVATPEDIERWESEREMYEPDVRLFVALFSYNPAVMSPNPETMEEELPFDQGQIIKVKMLFFYLNSQSLTMHHLQIISA